MAGDEDTGNRILEADGAGEVGLGLTGEGQKEGECDNGEGE